MTTDTDTNSNSPSPSPRPAEGRGLDAPSAITDSPNSSAPSTPNNDDRAGQVPIGNEDYFVTALRLRQDTKSAPGTPQGSMKRCATFSPRIAFYETWPSQEYDRRGEIATCNRLTPVLAQQIKEELNSFKMVSCNNRCSYSPWSYAYLCSLTRKWKFTRTLKSTRTSSDESNVTAVQRAAHP